MQGGKLASGKFYDPSAWTQPLRVFTGEILPSVQIFVPSAWTQPLTLPAHVAQLHPTNPVGELHNYAELSLFPNWIGGVQLRHVGWEGERLILTSDPVPTGGQPRSVYVIWERA